MTPLTELTSDKGNRNAPLQPRYRRLLSFGAVLDEVFHLFRRAWRLFIAPLLISTVPTAIIGFVVAQWVSGTALSFVERAAATATSSEEDLRAMPGFFAGLGAASIGYGALYLVVFLPAAAAVMLLTDGEMRGRRPPALTAYMQGWRATPALLATTVAIFVGLVLLTVLAVPLFLLGVFGLLGGLVALIALLVWWGKPGARRGWLRWLIILATPFGLPAYFVYRWSLALPMIVLEGAGPIAAMRRSATLTRGAWFRVFGVLSVLGILVSILQAIPAAVVGAAAGAAGIGLATGGAASDPAWFTTLSNIGNVAGQSLGLVLFGALPEIGLVLLLTDLRNRHEGADIAERLGALDVAAGPPGIPAQRLGQSLSEGPAPTQRPL